MQSRYSNNQKKKKTWMIWAGSIGGALVIGAAVFWLSLHDWDPEAGLAALTGEEEPQEQPAPVEQPAEEMPAPPEEPALEIPETEPPEEVIDATKYPEDIELPEEPTVIDGILLANKQHPLPATYAPGESPEARAAFEDMRAEAEAAGIQLTAFSTYRDFGRQEVLYKGYVEKDGQEAADRYSARPGFSEHQTGLAFDIGETGQEVHWASQTFGETEGGKWLADNAHRFGFILRYPEGKEQITGYMHESWHYRHVGKEAAAAIYSQDVTLEEFLGVAAGSENR